MFHGNSKLGTLGVWPEWTTGTGNSVVSGDSFECHVMTLHSKPCVPKCSCFTHWEDGMGVDLLSKHQASL